MSIQHPTDASFALYLEDELHPEELVVFETHLQHCGHCQAHRGDILEADRLLRQVAILHAVSKEPRLAEQSTPRFDSPNLGIAARVETLCSTARQHLQPSPSAVACAVLVIFSLGEHPVPGNLAPSLERSASRVTSVSNMAQGQALSASYSRPSVELMSHESAPPPISKSIRSVMSPRSLGTKMPARVRI